MEVSDVVLRLTGQHEKGCEGLKQGLAKAEETARAAAKGLSSVAVAALEEVRSWMGGRE